MSESESSEIQPAEAQAISGSNITCASSTFDFYTTWSIIIFAISIIFYWFWQSNPSIKNDFVQGFIWFGLANAIAVGIIGHFLLAYPTHRENFTSDGQNKLQLNDDFMHLLPFIIWLVILSADYTTICACKSATKPVLVALILFLVVVVVYLLIPSVVKVNPQTGPDTCAGPRTNDKSRQFNEKIKLVYGRLIDENTSAPIILQITFVLVFMISLLLLVVLRRLKKLRSNRKKRIS